MIFPRKHRAWLRLLEKTVYAAILVALVVFMGLYLYAGGPIRHVRIHDDLMAPTFPREAQVMFFTWSYLFSSPSPGDVVVCELPGNDDDEGDVLVNRVVPCPFPDWKSNANPQFPLYTEWFRKDPGQPFFCGGQDNPKYRPYLPHDPIPLAALMGKAVLITEPLSAMGTIPPMPPMPEDGQP